MDSSTARRASPLCLDLTSPAVQHRKRGKKENSSKASGSFLSCLPPDNVFACTYQTLRETGTKTNTYSTHTDVYTHTHAPRKRISSQDH